MANYEPPTTFLPPIKSLQDHPVFSLKVVLDRLRELYVPSVRGTRPRIHSRTRNSTLAESQAHGESEDPTCDDPFERTYALRWISALACSLEESKDPERQGLVDDAAALVATCAGSSAGSRTVRLYTFDEFSPALELRVADAPLGEWALGALTWGSACIMADMVASDPTSFGLDVPPERSLRVLELGAGTGLLSLVIARALEDRRHIVIATDNHDGVLENLRQNIAVNSHSDSAPILVERLDWSEVTDSPPSKPSLDVPMDIIFGADVVYESDQAMWIKGCLERLLHPQGRFYMVIALRPTHRAESASVEEVFHPDHSELIVVSHDKIVSEAEYRGQDDVEYGYYIIEWKKH